MKTWHRLYVMVSILLLALTPSGPLAAQDEDYFPAAEWRTSTPEEQGIDSAKLLDALQYIEETELAIDSVTVIRHGYVVLDAYYYPYSAGSKHDLARGTMGVTSTLVGMALDRGWISLDRPFFDWMPDVSMPEEENAATQTTVGNLLEWTSGIYCNDVGMEALVASAPNATIDRIERVLAQGRMNLRGGVQLDVCATNSEILMGVMENAADGSLSQFADEELFAPLGIRDYQWTTDQNGLPFGSHGLWLTPHDMGRLGYLYLRNGQWNGQPIFAETWNGFVSCADPDLCTFENPAIPAFAIAIIGHGHHWVIVDTDSYAAWDWWGTMIVVTPEKDTVVVITSAGVDIDLTVREVSGGVLVDRVLASVVSDEPLPANTAALAELAEAVERAAQPTPAEPAPLPEIASQVSGHVYDFKRSLHSSMSPASADPQTGQPFDVSAFALTFDQTDEALLDLYYDDGTRVSVPVGLDGIWRTTETAYGLLAARGSWYTGPVSFRFEVREVGTDNRQLYNMRFDGERAFVGWVHSASLAMDQVQATMREP